MTIQLTPAQHAILTYAHQHNEGKISWFPENIKGGARKKVLDSLFNRALITTDGNQWFVSAEGYEALGIARRGPVTLTALDAVIASAERNPSGAPRKRENTKQALVLSMLRRPEGATIALICEATGWLPHTVRGTFAGAFKKKLGLEITSSKSEGSERTYCIITTEGQP
jgi:hypothetical protein